MVLSTLIYHGISISFQNRQKIAWDYLVSSPCSPPPPRVYPRAPIAKSQQVLYYQAFTRLHYFLQKRDASQLWYVTHSSLLYLPLSPLLFSPLLSSHIPWFRFV